jgi:hypothetical protein
MSWHNLKLDNDYEICDKYPYNIRKKDNKMIIGVSPGSHGYLQCLLNGKRFLKHRIVAYQWLPNDDPKNKIQVDHKDRNPRNNHINNLRWVTTSTNMFNRVFK